MSQLPQKLSLVLCEGKDDKRVFEAVRDHLKLDGVQVESYDGKDNLAKKLDTVAKRSDYTSGAIQRLLVTRDADDDYAAALQSVAGVISRTFQISVQNCGEWTADSTGTEFAIWIAPGNQRKGMIETLCLEAAREQDPTSFSCLNQFSSCMKEQHNCDLHDKERFAIWSIAAQCKAQPRQRMSLERMLRANPPNWDCSVFDELRRILQDTAVK